MRIFTKIGKLSVTLQVIILMTILILPINIIAVVFSSQVHHAFLSKSVESVSRAAEIYMYELDRRIYSSDTYNITEIDENQHVLELRKHKQGESFIREADFYWQQLNSRVRYALDADGYFFFIENENYLNIALRSNYNADKKDVKEYLLNLCGENTPFVWECREIMGKKWMVRKFALEGFYYGALINLNDLEKKFSDSLSMEESEVFFDNKMQYNKEKGRELIVVKSAKADIYMHISLSQKVLEAQIPLAEQIWFLIPTIYLIFIPIIIIVLKRIVIRPIQKVNHAMAELESGNSEYRITEVGENREANELNRRFNSMAGQLKSLKIQIYESELEKRDIEATNLRLQVNPHFIVNCLNIIFSLARSGKNREIKEFTKYLADYLRFSLWHTNGMIRLSDEMKCVENYLEIQKIRFPGTFSYIGNFEAEVMEIQIPSLLILNFVENAVKYAVRMGSEIEIIVSIRKEEDSLFISVCDTGNGMTEEMLGILRKGEIPENETGKHIGIWNCKRRLKMLYQESAYINITSCLGEGTQIFIKIPWREEKEQEQ